MRRIYPTPADDVDLREAYAWPADRVWVRANMVASADGAATLEGRSGGLNNAADRDLFGFMRGQADAILVGAGTVRVEGYGPAKVRASQVADREAAGQAPQPPMAVLTRSGYLDVESPFFTAAVSRPIVVTTEHASASRRERLAAVADVITLPGEDADLAAVVGALAERGLRRILCEGGPASLAHLAADGRLDELCLTLSPLLVGGEAKRILDGSDLEPPVRLHLAQICEEEEFLFLRYVRRAS